VSDAITAASGLSRRGGALSMGFAVAFHAQLHRAGWHPVRVPSNVRDRVFGTDWVRDLMEPYYWATLEGVPGTPAVIAEVDVSAAQLERDVAKYVWWTHIGSPAFWPRGSFLVSGLAGSDEEDAEVHKIIARSFGNELELGRPPLRFVLAEIDRRGSPTDCGRRLARVAYLELRRRVAGGREPIPGSGSKLA
jgi:hypothetical protein